MDFIDNLYFKLRGYLLIFLNRAETFYKEKILLENDCKGSDSDEQV